jgi:hypothetical protein
VIDGLMHPRWSLDFLRNGIPELANFVTAAATSVEAQAALMSRQMDASFDWDALAQLRDAWPGTLIVKGLLRAEDAKRCEALGVDGVVLSNHGGRQLDGAIAPIEALPAARAATKLPIMIDSASAVANKWQRRSASVLTPSSSDAARSMAWQRGGAGVDDVISIIRTELDRTLALIGCPSVDALSSDLIAHDTNSDEAPMTDTIRSVRVRAADVPLEYPVKTASGLVATAPLALIDIETSAGVIGHAYLFAYIGTALKPLAAAARELGELIVGQPAAPSSLISSSIGSCACWVIQASSAWPRPASTWPCGMPWQRPRDCPFQAPWRSAHPDPNLRQPQYGRCPTGHPTCGPGS